MTCRYLGQTGAELFIYLPWKKKGLANLGCLAKEQLSCHVVFASIKELIITLPCTLVKEEMGIKCLA